MTANCSSSSLLDCAVAAAHTAGNHALKHRDRRGEADETSHHDVKLRLDRECQDLATQAIQSVYPDHAILGEEDTASAPNLSFLPGKPAGDAGSEYLWIIDPLDGTVNFSHGMPLWCCSVAVRRGPDVVAGAVYAPSLGELFTATADGPAMRNGSAIRPSSVTDISRALVHTGFDRFTDTGFPSLEILNRIATAVQRPRILGSAALDICRVACGEADGYFESGVFIWDVAAAGLIAQRAGGQAEVVKRQGPHPHRVMFLASNGPLHEALRELVLP